MNSSFFHLHFPKATSCDLTLFTLLDGYYQPHHTVSGEIEAKEPYVCQVCGDILLLQENVDEKGFVPLSCQQTWVFTHHNLPHA